MYIFPSSHKMGEMIILRSLGFIPLNPMMIEGKGIDD
jgi:hypothetical protein